MNIILILNAGSSSIKFALYAADQDPSSGNLLCSGELSRLGHLAHFHATEKKQAVVADQDLPRVQDHDSAMEYLLQWVGEHYAHDTMIAAGHRVVHGGEHYVAPTVITDQVLDDLRRLIPLAPLHQPHQIAAILALQKLHPALTQIACFDTAFHHTNLPVATQFGLPRELTAAGIRRYGFHGLSYEYIASVLKDVLGEQLACGRIVVAHLGSGASMCAIRNGQSIASTMGLTALDGLLMSRRCGSIDPGVLLYLMQEKKMSADQISHLLYNGSGLLGVSGLSDDMKTLLASDDVRAAEAIDLFVYRIQRELGSLVAALGGLDAFIFTAGIGEHAALIRQKVADSASWLGMEIDPQINRALDRHQAAQRAVCLSAQHAKVSTWMIPTDEDLMIVQHSKRLLTRLNLS